MSDLENSKKFLIKNGGRIMKEKQKKVASPLKLQKKVKS